MTNIALVVIVVLFAVILWLLHELTYTAKLITSRNINHRRSDVVQLVAILIFIIVVIPFLFTCQVFSVFKSANGSIGEIGDAIGGLTAPFINGIGAILVYMAFKEQVSATNQTRNLEIFKIINDRLNWLKSDAFQISELQTQITTQFAARRVHQPAINKITYLLTEFIDIYGLSMKNTDESENLKKYLLSLYCIIYRDFFENIQKQAILFRNFNSDHKEISVVLEYMSKYEQTSRILGV
jgi:hypothetical protein